MNDTRCATTRRNGLRAAALLGVLIAAPVLLTACSSGSTAAPTTTVTSATTSTAVVSSTSDTVVTETDVVTKTTTAPSNGGGGSSSATDSCPDSATLGAVTPSYDPQYPIENINCSGEWAVGSYEADGKNQTTGIWRDSDGAWSYQDRAAICAAAVNLPPELYAQACNGN